MIIDAIIQSRTVSALGYRMFNIRNFTVFDKTCYTQLFPFATVILFNNAIQESRLKKKIIYFIWICLLIYVLFFLFQSKTGIAAVIISIFLEIFITYNRFRKKLIKFIIPVLVGLFVFILIVPFEVPDYVIALLSFLGLSSSTVNAVYYETYNFRFEIINNVLSIFKSYPLFGIGFGNYYRYVSTNNMQILTVGIEDIESSFFALFAEGGVVYFLLTLFLWISLYTRIKHNLKFSPEIIGTFICMIILLFGNDFMNLFYWVWLGIYWRISSRDNIVTHLQKN